MPIKQKGNDGFFTPRLVAQWMKQSNTNTQQESLNYDRGRLWDGSGNLLEIHAYTCLFYNFFQPCNSSLIRQQRHGRLQNEEEKDCIHYRQMSTTFCFALEACMYVYGVWNERKKFNDNFSFSFILLCVFRLSFN